MLIYTEWFPLKCLVHNVSSIKTGRSGTSWGCWLVTVIELAGVTAPFLLTEAEISPEKRRTLPGAHSLPVSLQVLDTLQSQREQEL